MILSIKQFLWVHTYHVRRWWGDTLPMWVAWKLLPSKIVLLCFVRVYSGLMEAPTDEYRRAYLKFVEDNKIEGM